MHAAPLRLAALAALLACSAARNGRNGGPPPPSPMEILEAANCHQAGINETETCYECHGGLDNDKDGGNDCDDPDCTMHPHCDPAKLLGADDRDRRGRGNNYEGGAMGLVVLLLIIGSGCTSHRCYRKPELAAGGGGNIVPFPYGQPIAARGTIVGSVVVGPGGAMQVAQPAAAAGGGSAGGGQDPFGMPARGQIPQRSAQGGYTNVHAKP